MAFVFVLVWVKLFGCLDLLVFVLNVGFDVCVLYVLMLIVGCFCCFSVYVCATTLFLFTSFNSVAMLYSLCLRFVVGGFFVCLCCVFSIGLVLVCVSLLFWVYLFVVFDVVYCYVVGFDVVLLMGRCGCLWMFGLVGGGFVY